MWLLVATNSVNKKIMSGNVKQKKKTRKKQLFFEFLSYTIFRHLKMWSQKII